ncbi:hypothetical protein D3C73_1252720 [compost metagenome]
MQRKSIGIVTGHDGNVGFNSMRQHVHPGVCDRRFWQGINKLRINDRHIRRQFIIRKRIFRMSFFFIRDYRK